MSYVVSTEILQFLGFVFAGLFVVLGAFDGIYFHLIKYKLHTFPESKFEHQIHSVRGILLALIGGLVLMTSKHEVLPVEVGALSTSLKLAMFFIVVDLLLEVVDIYVEKKSRANLGGISSSEMVLHVFASSFRMAAIVLLLLVAQIEGFSYLVNMIGGSVAVVSFAVGVMGFMPMPQALFERMELLKIFKVESNT
jgi:hypothetical protein